jgi:hypothetical protein
MRMSSNDNNMRLKTMSYSSRLKKRWREFFRIEEQRKMVDRGEGKCPRALPLKEKKLPVQG